MKTDLMEINFYEEYSELHFNDSEIEFLFVLSGSIELRIGNKKNVIKKGGFQLINLNHVFSYISKEKKTTVLSVKFDINNFNSVHKDIDIMTFDAYCEDGKYNVKEFYALRNLFIRLVVIRDKKTPNALDNIKSICTQIMKLCVSSFQDKEFISEKILYSEKQLNRYFRIKRYILSNLSNKILLNDIATFENISKYRFSHLWKELSGHSLNDIVSYYRIIEATKTILNTEKNIVDIMYEAGFSDSKYFYRFFKLVYDGTPKEIIKRKSGDDSNKIIKVTPKKSLEQTISSYAMKYYSKYDNVKMYAIDENIELHTQNLYYKTIKKAKNVHKFIRQAYQVHGYIQLDKNKYIFKNNGNVQIVWESFYCSLHFCDYYDLPIEIQINFDSFILDEWFNIINELSEEIISIWGAEYFKKIQFKVHISHTNQISKSDELSTQLLFKHPTIDITSIILF